MEKLNDVLGYKDLKIFQDTEYFSFSLDSIILSNYCNIRLKDKKIIDFCTGNGIVPLVLSRRCDKVIEGVEIQEKLYNLAVRSVEYNNLNDRIHLFCDDIVNFCNKSIYNTYDLVLCNPPYFPIDSTNCKNISYEKMIARHEIMINLDQVCECASKILKEHGNICIVHRSERLLDIFTSFRKWGIEPKRIKFIYEYINKESTMVLVEGQKKGNNGLKIDPPLVMYNNDGSFTEEYSKLQMEVRK